MTLDEAIKHCEVFVDDHERIKQIKAVTLEECKFAEEQRQLAEWLKELKMYRDAYSNRFKPQEESEEVIFNNLCDSCSNIGCEFQSGIVRKKCAFYMPPLTPQSKSEDIAKAFQMGLAIGFGERYDELDRVIDEIKKVINKQNKELENQLNASVQNVIDRESEEKDDKKKV